MLKNLRGRVVNKVEMHKFSFSKELQLHVLEIKPNRPFTSPVEFEESMQEAALALQENVCHNFGARLLGTGMHPLLKLDETRVWPHRDRQIYKAYDEIFSLKRYGWVNIQSYQLNLPYSDEESGVILHNLIASVLPYLPAIAASSPAYEGRLGEDVDNRLRFYKENQREIPSITFDVIPEYAETFSDYREKVIGGYSKDLVMAGADKRLLYKEWINSRGVIFRFDRKALEIRVLDEQECVKSDVALSCFIRALLRGLLKDEHHLIEREVLINNFNSVVKDGFRAKVSDPRGKTAREVCSLLLKVADKNGSDEERKFIPLIRKRINNGSLSEIIRERIVRKAQRTDIREAMLNIYLKLTESLIENRPYF